MYKKEKNLTDTFPTWKTSYTNYKKKLNKKIKDYKMNYHSKACELCYSRQNSHLAKQLSTRSESWLLCGYWGFLLGRQQRMAYLLGVRKP